jgi:LPS-assembly lipoprotein
MWWSRSLAAIALAAALAGCGFKPMYRESSDNGTTAAEFAFVSIAQPEDRREQLLRNNLLDLLTPLGSPDHPRYLLEYRVDESIGAVFTTRSEEVTRNNLILTVSYNLRDYESGKILYSVGTTSYSSYNLTVADYSNLISEKNARERALHDSAEQLRIRLGNYFGKYSKDKPAK